MSMTVLAVGSPFDGMSLYGPFVDADEAAFWAEGNVKEEWFCVEVITPTESVEDA